MTERDEMIAALDRIEAAAQQLAAGVTSYDSALHAVSRRVYGQGNKQFELQALVGTLPELLVRRLRGLGLDAVLERARTTGTLDKGWAGGLAAKIRAHVPEAG